MNIYILIILCLLTIQEIHESVAVLSTDISGSDRAHFILGSVVYISALSLAIIFQFHNL